MYITLSPGHVALYVAVHVGEGVANTEVYPLVIKINYTDWQGGRGICIYL